ncbi:MAG: hypothetical protein H7222_15225 [Methylotenera sp.]|nr:hypothetical protein [Oligoflexia bacterium]
MLEHHRFLGTFSPLLVVISQLTTFSPVWAAAPASVPGGASSCSKPGNLSELAAEVGGYRDLVNQISSCLTPELVKKYEVYQPNLYLDGEVLAHRVTAQVLAHKAQRENKLEVESLPSLGFSLFEGTQIAYPASEQQRDELRKWLETRKEGTITPDALFMHALDGAGGNVQRALICCWNQLSDGWNSAAIERNSRFTTLKLKDITGELIRFDGIRQKTRAGESHEFVRGDNFSAWYHFFGTALHAYTAERSRVPRLPTTAHDCPDQTRGVSGHRREVRFEGFKKEVEPGSFGRKLWKESRDQSRKVRQLLAV